MRITQEKLKEIIASHGKWLRCENGGERTDLRNADLSNADLRYASLGGANLDCAKLYGANIGGAVLRNANLYGADLCNANLSNADFNNADLSYANLCYANLSGASLHDADLSNADLRNANLCDANLCDAKLSGASLSKTYYQIVRIGSRNATTTYCVEDDNVLCGCWNNYKGDTLLEFKKRVVSIYGEEGKTPNKKYYTQYMAAIEFFEKMAKFAKMEEEV